MVVSKSVLRTVPLLSVLSDAELDQLVKTPRFVRHRKGSVVFHEGAPGDHRLILLSGRIKVVLLGEGGQELVLAILTAPDFLGEIALVDGAPRSATCITLEETELLYLTQRQFMTLLRQQPVAMKIMRHLAGCLRQADEQLRTLSMFDVHGRVVRCLFGLARQQGVQERARIIIQPRPSNQLLAHMIGSSRETVSRAMRVLHEAGYVTASKTTCVLEERAVKRYGYIA